MLKVGITGNIASGKSLFEGFLKNEGFEVLCLDCVTSEIYKEKLFQDFLIKKIGSPLKSEASRKAFLDPVFKAELEEFIYPLIYDKMNAFFELNGDKKVVFVSGALIFEAGFDKYFDKILFLSAPIDSRIYRLMERNSLTMREALVRINSQKPEYEKIPRCDYVVENNSTPEALEIKAREFIKSLNIP